MTNSILVLVFLILGALEATVFPLPLSLPLFIALVVHNKGEMMYPVAVVLGVYLDIMLLRPIGVTSVFFLGVTFLCFLYQRKYEVVTLPFVLLSSFFFSLCYLLTFHSSHIFLKSIVCIGFSVVSFYLVQQIQKRKETKRK